MLVTLHQSTLGVLLAITCATLAFSRSESQCACSELEFFFTHLVVCDEVSEHFLDHLHRVIVFQVLCADVCNCKQLIKLTLMFLSPCTAQERVHVDVFR